jgi:hypothetical protein
MVNTSNSNPEVPEGINSDYINGLVDKFRAYLIESLKRFKPEDVQDALESGQLDTKIEAAVDIAIEQAVAEVSGTIVRIIPRLDLSRKLKQAIEATGRHLFSMVKSALETVPSDGTGIEENVPVHFFKIDHPMTPEEVEQEYESLDLIPVDPRALVAVNEFYPEFADEYPQRNAVGS